MPLALDITGERYGRLVAVSFVGVRGSHKRFWVFRCDCGAEKTISLSDVRAGRVRSCGCLRVEQARVNGRTSYHPGPVKHGKCYTPEYRVWKTMLRRVRGLSSIEDTELYVARGITCCERWQKFENFIADMGPRPPGTSIERIDNNGPYSPENCRWATAAEQRQNRRPRRPSDVVRKARAEAAQLFRQRRAS